MIALSKVDRAANVAWAGEVRLGKAGDGPRVRVVQVRGDDETILLATTLPAAETPPEPLAQLDRNRWQVELFFPVAEMHSGLPALARGKRARGRAPVLSRAHRRVTAAPAQGPAADETAV
ncbi:MAG: hypothetical protein RLZZ15_2288 [Verrucomicrobiota bacterium]